MQSPAEKTPNIKLAVPFFRVANMQASLKFYTEGLGFAITNTWTPRGVIEWCWLERDKVSLMLQQPASEWVEKHPAEGKPGAGVSITFQCVDALAIYHEFCAKGLTPSRPFVGNGMWVTCIADPDGYHLDFESITSTPEGTEYTAPHL